MPNLVRVLDQPHPGVLQSDIEKFHKVAHKSKDLKGFGSGFCVRGFGAGANLVPEHRGPDGAGSVDEEHQVGLLLGTGGQHGANATRREVRAGGHVHVARDALAAVAPGGVHAVRVVVASVQGPIRTFVAS